MQRTILILAVVACAALAIAALAHGRSSRRDGGAAEAAPARPLSAGALGAASALERTLGLILSDTTAHESGKDATCWTTVRIMDAHFAGRPMSDAVALVKIEACRTLVYDLWQAASARAAGGADASDHHLLHAQDIDSILPAGMRGTVALMAAAEPAFGNDPVRSVMNRDYHRITENRRYLASILSEAIAHVGLFERRPVDISPLTEGAIVHLAAAATVTTTDLLAACARSAVARQHEQVEADDVREAFAESLQAIQAVSAPAAAAPEVSTPAATSVDAIGSLVDQDLLACSRRAIAGKIAALRAWNGKVWAGADDPAERERELLNRLLMAKLDRDAFTALKEKLTTYVDYLARGITPMQHNTFWNSLNGPSLVVPPPNSERERFVTLPWAANALENLFPRAIAANGDVTVQLLGDPAHHGDVPRSEVRMLDWELDAVRDTTLHWTMLESAWASPDARPADPFALELIADRASELAFLYLKVADGIAGERHQALITRDIITSMLHGAQFVAPVREAETWTDADRARKAAVLSAYPPALFVDVSAAAGLPTSGALKRPKPFGMYAPERIALIGLMGSGVAVGDFDGDSLPDLFLPGDGGNRLLRNLGGRRFEDVTAALGITDPDCEDAHHALFVDYDGDGRLDLFVVHSSGRSRMFHQEPDGRFADRTDACGIRTVPGAHDAVFFDYDGDGLLDCYVGNYGTGFPALGGRNATKHQLWRNLGDGRFEDVTDRAGVGSTGWTLATAAIDVDRDGRMDLFVANDYGRSELFINRGDGTFAEQGHAFGVDDRGSSMNASVIDADGDGWMDLYVTQIDMFSKSLGWIFPQADSQLTINERILKSTFYITGNKLFHNEGGRHFAPIEGGMFEPGDRGWSWSGNFFDYDNDGDDDLYLTNGWIDGTPAGGECNQFFIRDGGRFYLVGAGPEGFLGNSRGAVAADLTGSGAMDLVVSAFDAPPRLLANASGGANHWLKVKLSGAGGNRQGIGAVVRLTRADGTMACKQVNCGANYLSQDETTLTFGLGKADAASAITVVWPGNHEQRVSGPLAAGSLVMVTETR